MTTLPQGASFPGKPKPPAASHMLWFFVLPAVVFMGWASFRLFDGLLHPKPNDVFTKLEEIRTARSTGDRWQSAYAMAQALQKMVHDHELEKLDPVKRDDLYAQLSNLLTAHEQDVRLKKYLLLTLGQMGQPQGLAPLEQHLDDKDPEVRFYSSWGYLDILTKHPELSTPERRARVAGWLTDGDASFRKIAAAWLVQQKDPALTSRVRASLADSDAEVRLNAAVALASIRDPAAAAPLKDFFTVEHIRAYDSRNGKDLEQLVATAHSAAVNLGDPAVLQAENDLKNSVKADSPEGHAILLGLRTPPRGLISAPESAGGISAPESAGALSPPAPPAQ